MKQVIKKYTKRQIESLCHDAFKHIANRVEFNVLDISEVLNSYRLCLSATQNTQAAEEAMRDAVQRLRVN